MSTDIVGANANLVNAQSIANKLGSAKRSGNGWITNCPAHEDNHASLSITDDTNGKILLKCHAGCSQGDVIGELKRKGLWARNENNKQFEVATYDYINEDGELLYQKVRYEPKHFSIRQPDGKGGWINNLRGLTNRVLYRLPIVRQATTKNLSLLIVEGEKDADTCIKHGLRATTNDFGAGKWDDRFTRQVKGSKPIIVPDNDEAGEKHALLVAEKLRIAGINCRIVKLPGLPPKGDISDWFCQGHSKQEFIELAKATAEYSGNTDLPTNDGPSEIQWQEPVLFGEIETPEIPASLLPVWLGSYAEAVSKATQTPPGMAAMQALAVAATCLQKKVEVCLYGDEYTEPVSLWTVTAMPPASRKTAVLTAMTAPLVEWETTEAERLKQAIAEDEANQKVLAKRINELESRAAKTDDSNERQQLVKGIAELKGQVTPGIVIPRLWTADVTSERLENLLVEQNEKMAVLSDEGGIFEVMAGLYNDGKVNLDIFLKGHAGSPTRTDRASRKAHLEKPALTFGLVVQPAIISDFSSGSKRRFRGNGALARFLYCIPKSNIGSRNVRRHDAIPTDIKAAYHSGIKGLLAISSTSNYKPLLLTLSPEARESCLRFASYIESRQGDGNDLEAIQDWSGKLPGAALRIAGLCHVVEHGVQVLVINKETIERALDLCELLIVHAQAAFNLMGSDPCIEDAKYIFNWIISRKQASFKQTELHQTGRFKNSKVDRLIHALDVLIGRHIISGRHSLNTRKPTYIYHVNNAILGDAKNGMA
jgi:putative DNA primase/helicase